MTTTEDLLSSSGHAACSHFRSPVFLTYSRIEQGTWAAYWPVPASVQPTSDTSLNPSPNLPRFTTASTYRNGTSAAAPLTTNLRPLNVEQSRPKQSLINLLLSPSANVHTMPTSSPQFIAHTGSLRAPSRHTKSWRQYGRRITTWDNFNSPRYSSR